MSRWTQHLPVMHQLRARKVLALALQAKALSLAWTPRRAMPMRLAPKA